MEQEALRGFFDQYQCCLCAGGGSCRAVFSVLPLYKNTNNRIYKTGILGKLQRTVLA
jgi:hypothetical protein